MTELEISTGQTESPISRERNPFVKVPGPYLVSRIDGNPYILQPIKISKAISFLEDPADVGRKRITLKDFDSPQLDAFEGIVHEGFYSWMQKNKDLSTQELLEEIKRIRGVDEIRHIEYAARYREYVQNLGEESEISTSPYAINLMMLQTRFKISGQSERRAVDLTGRFDEVHKGKGGDQILRIRTREGAPTNYDAMKLGMDLIAYMAYEGKDKPKPKLKVLNLIDGEIYGMVIFNDFRFFKEMINAIILSDIAREMGYEEESPEKEIAVFKNSSDGSEFSEVEIRTKGRRSKLSADDVYKKGVSAMERFKGRTHFSESQFGFYQEGDPIIQVLEQRGL